MSFHLRAAVQAASSSIIMVDQHDIIRDVNSAFELTSGFSRAEVVGKSVVEFRSGKHSAAFYDGIVRTLAAGQPWRGRWVSRKKDGTCFEVEGVITPVLDDAHQSAGSVTVMRDVTAERLLERELRQSQKLEAIGRLAKGVAHDFTNMLMVINGSAEALKMFFPDRQDIIPHLDRIIEAAGRSSELTSQLMAFARKQPLSLRTMNVNRIIESLRDLLVRTLRGNIKLTMDICPDASYANVDPAQIEQIIMHLVVNAQDAMPSGGHITIATRILSVLPEESRQIRDVLSERDRVQGDYVRILVSDTGCGMDSELQQKAFDPFFTTKGNESSTGLGLSTVYGIIKQHDGHVTLYSNPGVGTTFSVYLPLAPERNACMERMGPVPGGAETIMVIEDDAILVKLVTHALQEFGYTVLGATSADEGLTLMRQTPHAVALVLMDVFLPGIHGPKLMEQLHALSPASQVVYTSGYPEAHLKKQGILHENDIVLSKPLLIGDLAKVVRKQIDRT